jgi:SH3-like domain-containing protein
MPTLRRFPVALVLALTLSGIGAGLSGTVVAEEGEGKSPLHSTGLPLPRFVTLRSDEVNARTGPGVRYPVEWVFVRKEMPVEITAEFDTWRRIRDWEGSEGWVHQSMLSGKRGVVIRGETRTIREEARTDAPVVARAEPGVMGWLHHCQGDWCQVDLKGYKGWITREAVWGVYPGEHVE